MVDPLRGIPISTNMLPSARLDRAKAAPAVRADGGGPKAPAPDAVEVRVPGARETVLKSITSRITTQEANLSFLQARNSAIVSVGEQLRTLRGLEGAQAEEAVRALTAEVERIGATDRFVRKLSNVIRQGDLGRAEELVAEETENIDARMSETAEALARARIEFENTSAALLPADAAARAA